MSEKAKDWLSKNPHIHWIPSSPAIEADKIHAIFDAGQASLAAEILEKAKENSDSHVTLDCGDNSCSFAENKSGMRTNGGCRCAENNPRQVGRYAVWARHRVKKLEQIIKDATNG